MKTVVRISQVIVGLLFIFSGFVKADDPLGFTYKLQEYFAADALNMPWMNQFSFTIAFTIPIVEMVLGMMILLGSNKGFVLILLVLLEVFFTFLTWYTAHYNKVLECGCFGDAIPMTSWQSFWKNIILMVFVLIIVLGNKNLYPVFKGKTQAAVIFIFLACSILFSWYCYNYLPIIDFRPYKVGTDIKQAMLGTPDVEKFYYTLKNKKTGETQEFDKFPDNYQSNYIFISSRTEVLKKGVEAKIKDFNISGLFGGDITDSILNVPGYQFLLVSMSINEANKDEEVVNKINAFANDCQKDSIGFICLTASDGMDVAGYRRHYRPPYKFYSTDATVLKTMIRSNPGLILLKAGVVKAMWHYHTIPTFSEVSAKYFH
jgi:uncharacterized membrane protein YphA (DoxX/SURF4 family)